MGKVVVKNQMKLGKGAWIMGVKRRVEFGEKRGIECREGGRGALDL